ncbi:MAG: TetR/AcrR family transcriptional regulator [Paracoccus sp. (in: a-proteobacteria)]|nr:TetR/AcrR family transcriptional regulator [Paracoccus sp. (in: a-proteobacteria)]
MTSDNVRPTPPRIPRPADDPPQASRSVAEILDCAAGCFNEMGYQGTSIDEVARRLGATKGRIYHYFQSKTDLFLEVHREGMRRLIDAVTAAQQTEGSGRSRLRRMAEAHALTIMENIAYEAVVVQGIHIHRSFATTEQQRESFDELMQIRLAFEQLFTDTFLEGQKDGSLRADANPAFAVKGLMGAVNWSAIWYRPREGQTRDVQRAIARDIVELQITGLR